MADVRITQVRSAASRKADQGRTLRALGLTRIRSSVVHEDRPEILGMINKVSHLVEVEPADAELHRRAEHQGGELHRRAEHQGGELHRRAEHPKTRGDGDRKRRGQ